MASVERWKGDRWRARYRAPDGRTMGKVFDRKVDAENFLTTVEHSKLTGSYVDTVAGKVTLREYAEGWRSAQVHRPSTAAQVRSNLNNHVYPQIGERPIGSVRPSEVQAWVKGRAEVLSPATVEVVYRYLSSIYKAAVADRVVHSSPCTGIKLPKQERLKVEPLATETVAKLIEAIPARYRAVVTLAAGSGLRQGELFGLGVENIEFLRRSVTVERQMLTVQGKGPTLGPPKTKASYRTVPLAPVVLEALSAHLAEFPAGPEGLVFTNDGGGPINRTRFSDVWRPVAKEAGLDKGQGMHALRHYYASLLIASGCSVKSVQDRLGHASAAETLDTYSHLWPDDEDRTRGAVESVLGPVVSPACHGAADQGQNPRSAGGDGRVGL